MMRWLSLFSILLSILVIGCAPPTTAKPADTMLNSPETKTSETGQELPISAKAILPNNTEIQLEVAQTPKQQEMGLMYRPALPDNRGMLFAFPAAQPVSFWMKNVPVSLDMVFLRNGIVQYIQAAAPPCTREPCATYGPNTLIDTVIELRSGRAAELDLHVGDSVKIKTLDSNTSR
jgi:uncharacterized membrane protein (UPF0127 family)